MQRRAAAIYFAFFLVVGAAAYAYIGVAQTSQQPDFSLEGPTLSAEESTTIDGTEYTVTELGHAGGGGGGHGGGGGGELVATLEWTNDSVRKSATLENGSSTTLDGTDYTVHVANESDVSTFTLREELNVSAILQNDPAVENTTATYNDTEQVVYRENGTIRPLSEYLPEPGTREFSVGDSYQYEDTETTVAEVTPAGVTLEWTASESQSAELQEGANVTLASGQQYFAHFSDDEEHVSLVSVDQYGDYAHTEQARSYFQERLNGLWGIVIISGFAAFLVLSAAYLPNRG